MSDTEYGVAYTIKKTGTRYVMTLRFQTREAVLDYLEKTYVPKNPALSDLTLLRFTTEEIETL